MFTNLVLLDVLLILTSFLAILYFWLRKKHSYWEKRGIRSLPGHWFFGHFKDAMLLRTPPGVLVGKLYQQAADDDDVLGIYILHKPFLLLRNPELIKQMFIRDFHVFPNHHFTGKSKMDQISCSNLFSLSYPKWKHLR